MQNPRPIPGCSASNARGPPRVKVASVSAAELLTPRFDTAGKHASRWLDAHAAPATHVSTGIRTAASAGPMRPALPATVHSDPPWVRSDNSRDPFPTACRPGARSPGTARRRLQAPVFIFQTFQLLRLVHFRAAVLRLPDVDRCVAHPDLPGQLRYFAPCFVLLQDADDLLVCKPTLLHLSISFRRFLPTAPI